MKPVLWLVLLTGNACPAWGEVRTWTTANGRQSAEAEFVLANEEDVFLRLSDGQCCWLPVANFSGADQAYIQRLVRQSGGLPTAVWTEIRQFAKAKHADVAKFALLHSSFAELPQQEIQAQRQAYWEIQIKLASDAYPPGAIEKELKVAAALYPHDYVWQLKSIADIETKKEADARRAAYEARKATYGLGLTRRGYNAIEEGMGRIDVDLILDCSGVESSRAGSIATYTWRKGFVIVTAMFERGKLVSKAQVGL